MKSISANELMDWVAGGEEHALLDARREGEFALEHLFFASNIPASSFELKIELLVPRRNTRIVIVESGGNSARLGSVLSDFGYLNLFYLEGGNVGWQAAGGRLYSGVNVPSKAFGEFIEHAAGTPHVTPEVLNDWLRSGLARLFDARPFDEFQNMSIHSASNCPGGELTYRLLGENVPQRGPVVVNCAGRTRSIIGAQSLIDAGFPDPVYALRDGTMGWQLASLPLERMASKVAPAPEGGVHESVRRRIHARAENLGVHLISPSECDAIWKQRTSRTTYLFDVRDPAEYMVAHRAGAISAPGGQLVQTFDAFVAVRLSRIILCDSDGVRAASTACWLRQMGMRDVYAVTDIALNGNVGPDTGCADHIIAQGNCIAPTDAMRRMSEGAVLYDLASSKEFRSSHICGAQFIERSTLQEMKLPSFRATLLLTSGDGRLARLVSYEMSKRGIDAYAIDGGTRAWRSCGLPVASGRGNLPEQPDDVFYRPYDLEKAAEKSMQAYLEWEKGLLERIVTEPGVEFSRLS